MLLPPASEDVLSCCALLQMARETMAKRQPHPGPRPQRRHAVSALCAVFE